MLNKASWTHKLSWVDCLKVGVLNDHDFFKDQFSTFGAQKSIWNQFFSIIFSPNKALKTAGKVQEIM